MRMWSISSSKIKEEYEIEEDDKASAQQIERTGKSKPHELSTCTYMTRQNLDD